jgi:hypothetical protein
MSQNGTSHNSTYNVLQNSTLHNGRSQNINTLQNYTCYKTAYCRTVLLHNGKRYQTKQRYKTVPMLTENGISGICSNLTNLTLDVVSQTQ